MTVIRITAVETINYEKDYELEELEEYLGKTLAGDFAGDVDEFVNAIGHKAHEYSVDSPGFAEDLERHGDVQGQTWSGEVVE
jgi:hypothetical protein